MKKAVCILMVCISLLSLFGCGKKKDEPVTSEPVPTEGKVEPRIIEGVTVTPGEPVNEKNEKTGIYTFTLPVTIHNGTDVGIMSVRFTIDIFDGEGEAIDSFSYSFNGQDTPIAPGEDRVIEYSRRIGEVPAAKVTVTIESTADENELPPVKLPKKGEYLYKALSNSLINHMDEKLPVSIKVYIDHGGAREVAAYTSEDDVKLMSGYFMKILVGDETNEFVTDNYNWIVFEFGDGTTAAVSLNLYNLEINCYGTFHIYTLEGLGDFWRKAQEDAVPEY